MKKAWLPLLLLAVLPLAYNACKSCGEGGEGAFCVDGTGTGNPMTTRMSSDSQASYGNGMADALVTEALLHSACGRIVSCHAGVSFSACEAGMKAASGADRKLGLVSNRYPTFADIMRGEKERAFLISQNAAMDCASRLANLACSSREIQDSYQPAAGAGAAFAKIMETLDPVCRGVFLEKSIYQERPGL